jgi:hypothetical protein
MPYIFNTNRIQVFSLFFFAFLFAGCRREPTVQWISSKTLTNFPSASAIEFDNGKLYLFGDDAAYMLVLDTAYRQLDTIRFLEDTSYRLSKETKPDIESSVLIRTESGVDLFAISSFSSKERASLLWFQPGGSRTITVHKMENFYKILTSGTPANIEGLAMAGNLMVMANRANGTQKINQLILSPMFENATSLKTMTMDLSLQKGLVGVSGLFYVEKRDLMLFTASTEATFNAMEDGVIGDSYLGWIGNFSSHLNDSLLKPDKMINLADVHPQFKGQKVESVCMEFLNGTEMLLHLAADNDNGQSTLFKVKLKL